jgi:hypothetical protein
LDPNGGVRNRLKPLLLLNPPAAGIALKACLAGGLDSLALSRWARRVGMSTFGLCGKVDVARRAGLITMGRQPIGGYSFLTANAPTTLPEMVCRYLAALHD